MGGSVPVTRYHRGTGDGGARVSPPGVPCRAKACTFPFPAGFLVSTDAYMNLQLANTEEYIDGQFTGNLGEVLIR